jgi:uncharacterized protein involved in response to NO
MGERQHAGEATRPRPRVTDTVVFPMAALYAAIAVPVSVSGMLGGRLVPPGLATPAGHAHELLFGYALAVAAGFLIPRATPRRLGLLVGLWAAARLAFLTVPDGLVALAANVAFAATVAASAVPQLVRGAKRWRNRITGPLVLTVCAAVAVFHLAAIRGAGATQHLVLAEAVLLFALLMLFFAGRLIVSSGVPLRVRVQPRLEAALLVAMIGAIVASALAPGGRGAGALLLASGVLALLRVLRWAPWGKGVEVLCLGVGYAWLGVGLVLLGGSRTFDVGLPPVVATHAITIGALGTLTTHVMARVRLLRLRSPRSDRAPWLLAMAGAMSAAALLRMLGAARPAWLLAAAGCWSLAELLLLAVLARDR